MKVKNYPEYFGAYKVYQTVENVLKKNFREKDVEAIFSGLERAETKPDDFIRKLALELRRHAQSAKAGNLILDLKDALKKLIDVKVEPKNIELTKTGQKPLKIYVENKTDAALKFNVGIKQLDRLYTAILYDLVKNYSLPEIYKSHIVMPGKAHVFKFMIKADVFGIQDLYELKEKKKVTITLGVQAAAEGVEGLKTSVEKIPVNFVKVRI